MDEGNPRHTNRLIDSTSPYLLQHAHNPVDWYPWAPQALERARREDRPILLSVGYSACHWCHVMAHESFEDGETAALMNRLYVNIKVDREERPDLDRIYQSAHQLLAQRPGGWPLTVFLTPDDHLPFFAGTYFPREARFNLPSFREVLRRVRAFYEQHRGEIERQNRSLVQALEALDASSVAEPSPLSSQPLEQARRELEAHADPVHGGIGGAPKFPHTSALERLLRHWWARASQGQHADSRALEIVTLTLSKMAHGGIYDQLGGGFCRYSVDERWMIPHFEKMLYDNGPLLALYTDAWQATGRPLFRRVAAETAAWVMREMQSPEGGYYSTLDADSEGEEGKFYVWSREEVQALLGSGLEYAVFAERFGLDRQANFEGRWHLHVFRSVGELAQQFSMSEEEVASRLDSARRKLFHAREQRIRPGRDEKILTAWNGLMIKGMARAGRVLREPTYLDSAERALELLRRQLRRDGRLLATYKDGKAHLPAYLDDYAFVMEATLELLEARWNPSELTFLLELAEVLLSHFEDRVRGGFFFTADDHETLIHRPKPLADESTPAGNGIAAHVLGRLGHLLGESRYLEAAERTLRWAMPAVERYPSAHNAVLLALEEYIDPPETVVLRGTTEAMAPWWERSVRDYAPRRMVLAIPAGVGELPGVLGARRPRGQAVAYVCRGRQCSAPIVDFAELDQSLRAAIDPVPPAQGSEEGDRSPSAQSER